MKIERANDPDIQAIFKSLVSHLSQTHKPHGGGKRLFIFSDPIKDIVYKMFIQDIKKVTNPHIVIRKS